MPTNAATTETANCPRCHGTGSGLYNALSPKSTCEVCDGTGLATPAQSPATPAARREAHR